MEKYNKQIEIINKSFHPHYNKLIKNYIEDPVEKWARNNFKWVLNDIEFISNLEDDLWEEIVYLNDNYEKVRRLKKGKPYMSLSLFINHYANDNNYLNDLDDESTVYSDSDSEYSDSEYDE